MSNCEIFVELVSEKWLFLCVEAAIPPLQSAVQRGPPPHKGIAGFSPQIVRKKEIKSRISCEFFRNFLLRIFNIFQKIAKFDIESDFQKSSFSSKLDKNNWTRKIGIWSHPGFFPFFAPLTEIELDISVSSDLGGSMFLLVDRAPSCFPASREAQFCLFF